MFNEHVRGVLGKLALMDDEDPRMEEYLQRLLDLLLQDEEKTIQFLEQGSRKELLLISELFPEVAYTLGSEDFLKYIYQLDKKHPELDLLRHIETDPKYLN
ncbi:hypothetical protein FZC79_00105 [Rossellomorea vietnamensis]|uniref:Uncharacterized protein n=2 Tax=Rossellomorea TaxID=2837508 RepID=A0A5D4KK45_9BACI|nr:MULTISPECIES: hypothetical protein [Rossellomorea]TYR77269.1 hypothetical protein FZC79_00105 [Rossellomorea vietnamensis]TYS78102.1 hypothetical protein FZC80_12750 [Rossellomorea aquimaris]